MKTKITILASLLGLACSTVSIASTPSATTEWVKRYVATNTVESASASKIAGSQPGGIGYVTNMLKTDMSTNVIEKAAAAMLDTVTPMVSDMCKRSVEFKLP